jgi:O-antigen ligase
LLAYPILGTLVAFTALPSLAGSMPVRAAVLALSLALIVRMPARVLAQPASVLILCFWFVYLLRLWWDITVAGIPQASGFMFNLVGFAIPPALAMLYGPNFDEKRLARQLLFLGCAGCALALLASLTGLAGARTYSAEDSEGRLFLETVNPITFGHAGVTTLIAAVVLAKYATRRTDWAWVVLAAALGLASVQVAGSRGPVVALAAAVLTLAIFSKRYRRLAAASLVVLAAAAVLTVLNAGDEIENVLLARAAASAAADEPEIRFLLVAGAVQQFLEQPWLGSASVEFQYMDYPHNPFVEAAMATGVLGLLLFVAINGLALRNTYRALRRGAVLLPLLLVQAFVAAQFSGSLAASATMWMLLALLASPQFQKRQRPAIAATRSVAPPSRPLLS